MTTHTHKTCDTLMQSSPYYTLIYKSVEMCFDILHDDAITKLHETDNSSFCDWETAPTVS